MKKMMIVMVAAALAACGGGGGDESAVTGSGDAPQATATSSVPLELPADHDIPHGKMIRDRRFDERGRIIGVYAVPYNPCDHKPCEKK